MVWMWLYERHWSPPIKTIWEAYIARFRRYVQRGTLSGRHNLAGLRAFQVNLSSFKGLALNTGAPRSAAVLAVNDVRVFMHGQLLNAGSEIPKPAHRYMFEMGFDEGHVRFPEKRQGYTFQFWRDVLKSTMGGQAQSSSLFPSVSGFDFNC